MRRITPLLVIAALAVTACGSDTAGESASSTTVASGDSSGGEETPASTTLPAVNPDKPKVKIPAELPTELVKTELQAGSGEAAATGDTVIVHYVGVRSEDGTEFDNSWDRFEPFPVVLGGGQVIQGWDEGLLDTQAGGQYQLDIPAALAYGDSGAGEIIKPGDAITFVVDVLAVIKPSVAADQPDITVPTSTGATEITTEDLVVGDGATVETGDTPYIELIAFRGDTGEQIDSTWGTGGPFAYPLTADSMTALVTGIEGMKVGGRRRITIPSEQAFGSEGSTEPSIPGDTDLIVVIDVTMVL